MKKCFLFLLISMPLMADQVRVQILIKEDTAVGRFQDALYYDFDAYKKMDPSQIDKDRQARIDSWVNSIQNPPPPEVKPEPTEDQLTELIAEIQMNIDIAQKQLADTQTKLSDKKSK